LELKSHDRVKGLNQYPSSSSDESRTAVDCIGVKQPFNTGEPRQLVVRHALVVDPTHLPHGDELTPFSPAK